MDGTRRSLVVITAAGLGLDAWMHLRSAHGYDRVGTTITEGAMFRIEAVVALLVLIALLARPARLTAGLAAVVTVAGTFALIFTYWVPLGPVGPIPDLYEHVLYPEKIVALAAMSVAAVCSVVLVVIGFPASSPSESSRDRDR